MAKVTGIFSAHGFHTVCAYDVTHTQVIFPRKTSRPPSAADGRRKREARPMAVATRSALCRAVARDFPQVRPIASRDRDFIARIRVVASRSPSSRASPWTIDRSPPGTGSHRHPSVARARRHPRGIFAAPNRRRTGANARGARWG